MDPVTVSRYEGEGLVPRHEDGVDPAWLGYVETKNWIVYENSVGELHCFNGRTETGAAKGPIVVIQRTPYDNVELAAAGVYVSSDGSVRTEQAEDA